MKALNSIRRTRSAIHATAAAILLLAPSIAVAQQPVAASSNSQVAGTALSLDDAVKVAESQSEAVSIARAGVQRTQGQQMQARSQYFPQIAGSPVTRARSSPSTLVRSVAARLTRRQKPYHRLDRATHISRTRPPALPIDSTDSSSPRDAHSD
jgi:hypothetical protein